MRLLHCAVRGSAVRKRHWLGIIAFFSTTAYRLFPFLLDRLHPLFTWAVKGQRCGRVRWNTTHTHISFHTLGLSPATTFTRLHMKDEVSWRCLNRHHTPHHVQLVIGLPMRMTAWNDVFVPREWSHVLTVSQKHYRSSLCLFLFVSFKLNIRFQCSLNALALHHIRITALLLFHLFPPIRVQRGGKKKKKKTLAPCPWQI